MKFSIVGCRIYEAPASDSGPAYAEGKKIGWNDGVSALRCIVRSNPLPSVPRRMTAMTTACRTPGRLHSKGTAATVSRRASASCHAGSSPPSGTGSQRRAV